MIINDGSGSGNSARVNSENRIGTESVQRTIEQHINKIYAKTFTLPFDGIDPVGADDYFLSINNTGSKNLHITHVRVRSTVAGTVEIHQVTGTASFTSGTSVTPVNLTVGSSNTITSTIMTDTNTTGFTNQGVMFYHRLGVANTSYELKVDAHIIIPPGQKVAFLWDTSTGILSGNITIYEDQGVV